MFVVVDYVDPLTAVVVAGAAAGLVKFTITLQIISTAILVGTRLVSAIINYLFVL